MLFLSYLITQVRPTYTVTPTGPHSLKFSTQYGSVVDSVVKSKNSKGSNKKGNNLASDQNSTGIVLTKLVSVQTPVMLQLPDNSEGRQERMKSFTCGNDENLFKATDCCLDIASRALEQSEEIVRDNTKDLEAILQDGSEPWDLNSSEDLIKIISSGDLFVDGHFGRRQRNETEVTSSASGSDIPIEYQLPKLTWGANRKITISPKSHVSSEADVRRDDEESGELILDEKTGKFNRVPASVQSRNEAQLSREVGRSEESELILDEQTGEFISGESKKLARDFNSKCSVAAERRSINRTKKEDVDSQMIRQHLKDSKHTLKIPEIRLRRVTFSDAEKELRRPRPAHSRGYLTSEASHTKAFYEDNKAEAVDLRKSSIGLQVDGNDDSWESDKSDTSVKSEETTSEYSTQNSKTNDNIPNQDSTEYNMQSDQTPSEYSEVYGQNSTQKTATEPSSPPSEMLVSPDTTGSTVEGYLHYYGEEEPEYQPEGYRNISTIDSPSAEDNTPPRTVDDDATESENQSEVQGPSDVQGPSARSLEREARQAISSCDQFLASFEGSHLDMSTVSVITTGSMNMTIDFLLTQENTNSMTSTQQDARNENKTSSTVTLEVMDNDHNYHLFTRGISFSSSPNHPSRTPEPTQVLPQGRNETHKRALSAGPSEDLTAVRKQGKKRALSAEPTQLIRPESDTKQFKKAIKKCEIKSSERHSAATPRVSSKNRSASRSTPREGPFQKQPKIEQSSENLQMEIPRHASEVESPAERSISRELQITEQIGQEQISLPSVSPLLNSSPLFSDSTQQHEDKQISAAASRPMLNSSPLFSDSTEENGQDQNSEASSRPVFNSSPLFSDSTTYQNAGTDSSSSRSRSPVRGWRRAQVSEEAKNKVRGIAQRLMPGLYGESDEPKKPPPKLKKRRKSSRSCKDDWLKKIMKDDDTDASGTSQVVANDPYAFREETEETDANIGQPTTEENDADTTTDIEGFSTPLGSSISFRNAQLSESLGPLNNPFR